jgi:uncharacterized phage protein gp47/JayE
MAYSIKTFAQIKQLITQEIRNSTGLAVADGSDAAIRAEGTAAVVEGLYQHQTYIQKQLFIATADEPFLYIHANEMGLPRLGGTKAAGSVKAISNIDLTLAAGTQLTNGQGYYWQVTVDAELKANTQTTITVAAEQVGASWNVVSGKLLFVSPPAGLSSDATVISIGGGTDEESLEDWRARLAERQKLGEFKDRRNDIKFMLNSVGGIEHIYFYPKRRGLGSLDIAITAKGTPPTLPTEELISAAQAVMDDYFGVLVDCKIYSPTEQLVDVTAILTGTDINLIDAESVIRGYFSELAPADTYQAAVLSARLLNVSNVLDVSLIPNQNITPTVDWMHLHWLRVENISLSTVS